MRKKLGLFIIVGILMSAGVASADRGFWFSSGTTWTTIFNISNTGTASTTATVEFFDINGTSLGSTTATVAPNENWNFDTTSVGSITQSTLEAGTRGVAIVSGTTPGEVRGHISIFNNSFGSGFQMRIRTGTGSDTNADF